VETGRGPPEVKFVGHRQEIPESFEIQTPIDTRSI